MTITGCDSVIAALEKYRDKLDTRKETFLRRLAEIGIEVASVKFANAQYDGINDVEVPRDPQWDGDKLIISATGQAVAFIEFGTGVHYTETHPKAAEFGAIRGSYGYGRGRQDAWTYKGDPGTDGRVIPSKSGGTYILTHGNPPARAMYDAAQDMRSRILEIAKEVYGND